MSQANNGADLDASASGISSSGSKRKRSFVWDHFTKLDNAEKCVCDHCGRIYTCNSTCGTGHLWRHLDRCEGHKKGNVSQEALQTLNLGHTGVRIKVEELRDIHEVKDCLRKTKGMTDQLALTKATITRTQLVSAGDHVCLDLCSLMKHGEGLLVGTYSGGLFLVHSEHSESNPSASRPFRVHAGPVHAHIALPDGKTCYLSELQEGKDVMLVNQNGMRRTAMIGRIEIESQPLILVEAMTLEESNIHQKSMSIFLQNAGTVGFVTPHEENNPLKIVIPVTSLKVGDEVLVRLHSE
ncbi:hypothetical protein QJS10_CPB18g01332 [Acorus calamus]|uniref:BED-type domain-containing protein n=1 Tax=Acorus calamus TaxID=4465 RepID=A0AAV9CP80_ACOCL|nr:hypothetical protein QJS10_CPB18g01332 [Acorus calamus]